MSLSLRPGYVYEVFDRQCEIGLQNLARIHDEVGDAITAVLVTGTDFGAQQSPADLAAHLPQPVQAVPRPGQRLDPRAHAVEDASSTPAARSGALLDDIVDAGFDALNPVQTSAAGMDPAALKQKYGDRITFWGGGIDTQSVLPFGTPDEVRDMVRERMRSLRPGRRLRLQHRPQRAGRSPGREPAGPVRGGQ